MVMNSLQAFIVLAIVYYAGEFIGTRTKAWIPSVFVTACLFLFGYWTFFPKTKNQYATHFIEDCWLLCFVLLTWVLSSV